MPDATWKAVERAIGRILSFIREGPTGLAGADGVTDRLVVQVKHRADFPRYLWEWIDSIREVRDCQRMPMVIVRLDDFVKYVKGAGDDISHHAG